LPRGPLHPEQQSSEHPLSFAAADLSHPHQAVQPVALECLQLHRLALVVYLDLQERNLEVRHCSQLYLSSRPLDSLPPHRWPAQLEALPLVPRLVE
jgi:hypothetical protein